MDGYMELFMRTGSPVFYTASKTGEEAGASGGEQALQCRKNSLQEE